MSGGNLIAHCGARFIGREELDKVQAPEPTATWFPLRHSTVLDRVLSTMAEAGFRATTMKHALTRNNARYFGVIDTESSVGTGVTLAVGVRNSIDKSFPIGMTAGHRVFVCDNMAFRSDILVVRKHTRNGEAAFARGIAVAVQKLEQFKTEEAARVRRLQGLALTREQKDSLILRAFEEQIVSARQLPAVIRQARSPEHDWGDVDSAWSLFNCLTYVLSDVLKSNPARFTAQTMRLQHLIDARFPEVAVAA
jgi:hypothetical protein